MLRGRMGRPLYALGVALAGMAALISFVFAFIVSFGTDSRILGDVVVVISGALIAIVQLPLHVRRLHDVGLSGWWLLVPAALTGVLWVSAEMVAGPDVLSPFSEECWAVLIPYGLTCAAGFVWPGHRESNRYGAPVSNSTWVNIPSTVAAAGLLLFLAWLTFTFFTS